MRAFTSIVAAFFAACSIAVAAPQYGSDGNGGGHAYNVTGQKIKVKIDDTPLSITIVENTKNLSSLNFFAYHLDYGFGFDLGNIDLTPGATTALGTFNKNATIEFYATDRWGNLRDKIFISSRPDGNYDLILGTSGSLVITINGGVPLPPLGQPLPGVFATLAFGGFAMVRIWRKRRATAA